MKYFYIPLSLIFLSRVSYGVDVFDVVQHLDNDSKGGEECAQLLSSLKSGSAKLLKPVAESNKLDISNISEQFGSCEANNFIVYSKTIANQYYSYTVKEIEQNDDTDILENFYTAENYRVYQGDVDHDGVKDVILYGSCLHTKNKEGDCRISYSYFKVIDLDNCSFKSYRQVFDAENKSFLGHFVGVLSYKNMEYFYDGRYSSGEHSYRMNIYKPGISKKTGKIYYPSYCRYKSSNN